MNDDENEMEMLLSSALRYLNIYMKDSQGCRDELEAAVRDVTRVAHLFKGLHKQPATQQPHQPPPIPAGKTCWLCEDTGSVMKDRQTGEMFAKEPEIDWAHKDHWEYPCPICQPAPVQQAAPEHPPCHTCGELTCPHKWIIISCGGWKPERQAAQAAPQQPRRRSDCDNCDYDPCGFAEGLGCVGYRPKQQPGVYRVSLEEQDIMDAERREHMRDGGG